MATVSVGWTTS